MATETFRPEPILYDSNRRAGPEAPRILVAEDDVVVARSMARMLRAAGFHVEVVHDGSEAIRVVTRSPFDAVLADVHMPNSSGVDLLRVARAYEIDVPMVLYSGEPELESALEAVELGAMQYLRKPVDPDALIDVLNRIIQRRRQPSAPPSLPAMTPPPPRDIAEASPELGAALDRALATMWVVHQPIVSVRGHRAVGYEALLRASEPMLPTPTSVIEAAERLGRAWDVGRRVRSLVAESVARAPEGAFLFVKLHPDDLLDPELASESSPLAAVAYRIVFELTERVALRRVGSLEARLSILRYMGYRMAIDDLGREPMALNGFADFEADFVKLDMSLVRDVHRSPARRKIIGALTEMCGGMGITAIAEGVEADAERDAVKDLGCDLMQGYLFAKPARAFATHAFA
jgi:EAL domain-containing protein (putative c-di-GMP-specific phosphodiesterase class I)/CheY-like chemotaxis protein